MWTGPLTHFDVLTLPHHTIPHRHYLRIDSGCAIVFSHTTPKRLFDRILRPPVVASDTYSLSTHADLLDFDSVPSWMLFKLSKKQEETTRSLEKIERGTF